MNAILLLTVLAVPPDAPPVVPTIAPPVVQGTATQEPDAAPVVKAADSKRFYFWAPWCDKCRYTAFAKKFDGVTVLDFDANETLAQSFGVEGLPAFVVVENGKPRRLEGRKTETEVRDFYGMSVSLPAAGPPAGVVQKGSVAAPAGFRSVNGNLVDADGAVVTEIDGKPVAQAAAPVRQVPTAGMHTHTCRSCGDSFTHADGSPASDHYCRSCRSTNLTGMASGGGRRGGFFSRMFGGR